MYISGSYYDAVSGSDCEVLSDRLKNDFKYQYQSGRNGHGPVRSTVICLKVLKKSRNNFT
jgi:hypothetical protein